MVLTELNDHLLAMFERARSVAMLTGAGISAESGVPTFRGGGDSEIWTWRGRPVTELSSAELIATDPKLVWEWFAYRRGMLSNIEPNPGHHALAEWERGFEEFALITQNIDDLHRAAGKTRFELCIRRSSPGFVRLANALPALYPKDSDGEDSAGRNATRGSEVMRETHGSLKSY